MCVAKKPSTIIARQHGADKPPGLFQKSGKRHTVVLMGIRISLEPTPNSPAELDSGELKVYNNKANKSKQVGKGLR
jgi:hypothetical protein